MTHHNIPAIKSETNKKPQLEFNYKAVEFGTSFEHEKESDQSNYARNGEVLDEDGDLILERNVLKSKYHILDEVCDDTLKQGYFTRNDDGDNFDEDIPGNYSEEVPVKKIKIGEHDAGIKSISPTRDKIKDYSDCCETEATLNDDSDLVQEIQRSVVTCQRCGINYGGEDKSDASFTYDKSRKDEYVVSDSVKDKTNIHCGKCVQKELPGEYGQKEILKANSVIVDGNKKTINAVDESEDDKSSVYYITISRYNFTLTVI